LFVKLRKTIEMVAAQFEVPLIPNLKVGENEMVESYEALKFSLC